MGIEITNIKRSGELKLGFKDKDGRAISFMYGMVLTEDMVEKTVLEESLKSGLLASYLRKGWIANKRINIQGAITGTPQEFKGITANELDGTAKLKGTEKPEGITDKMVEESEKLKECQSTEEPKIIEAKEIKASAEQPSTVVKKRGRPKKVNNISEQDIKDIELPKETPTLIDVKAEEKPKEDDFI